MLTNRSTNNFDTLFTVDSQVYHLTDMQLQVHCHYTGINRPTIDRRSSNCRKSTCWLTEIKAKLNKQGEKGNLKKIKKVWEWLKMLSWSKSKMHDPNKMCFTLYKALLQWLRIRNAGPKEKNENSEFSFGLLLRQRSQVYIVAVSFLLKQP